MREGGAERRELLLPREYDELDAFGPAIPRMPRREQLEQARGRGLELVLRNDERRADEAQRNALFSFSKKPSSAR